MKNFPALVVNGEVIIDPPMKNNAGLQVNGLTQIGQRIAIIAGMGSADVDILGALFIATGGIVIDNNQGYVNITAAPNKAAIQIWPEPGIAQRWSPSAGAFFRSIERK